MQNEIGHQHTHNLSLVVVVVPMAFSQSNKHVTDSKTQTHEQKVTRATSNGQWTCSGVCAALCSLLGHNSAPHGAYTNHQCIKCHHTHKASNTWRNACFHTVLVLVDVVVAGADGCWSLTHGAPGLAVAAHQLFVQSNTRNSCPIVGHSNTWTFGHLDTWNGHWNGPRSNKLRSMDHCANVSAALAVNGHIMINRWMCVCVCVWVSMNSSTDKWING